MTTVEELAEAVSILADTIWHEHYSEILSKEQIDYMVDNFQSKDAVIRDIAAGYIYRLIKDGNSDIGYCAVHAERDSLYLSKIYIKKEFRGKGHGKETFAWVDDYARKNGIRRIHLRVNRNNTDSIRAYEACGFIKYDEDVESIGEGFVMDDYLMEKFV